MESRRAHPQVGRSIRLPHDAHPLAEGGEEIGGVHDQGGSSQGFD